MWSTYSVFLTLQESSHIFTKTVLTDLVCPRTRLMRKDKDLGKHTTASLKHPGTEADVSRFMLTSDALAFLRENWNIWQNYHFSKKNINSVESAKSQGKKKKHFGCKFLLSSRHKWQSCVKVHVKSVARHCPLPCGLPYAPRAQSIIVYVMWITLVSSHFTLHLEASCLLIF